MIKEENMKKIKKYYIGYEKDYSMSKYVVLVYDRFLSGWGGSGKEGHYIMILCRDYQEVKQMIKASKVKDNYLTYIKYYNLEKEKIECNDKATYSAKMLIECPIFAK